MLLVPLSPFMSFTVTTCPVAGDDGKVTAVAAPAPLLIAITRSVALAVTLPVPVIIRNPYASAATLRVPVEVTFENVAVPGLKL